MAGTSSAYAERVVGGYYLEIIPNRDRLARYGLTVSDAQDVVAMASGAEPITTTADIKLTQGATSIRTENAKRATYIFVDIATEIWAGTSLMQNGS